MKRCTCCKEDRPRSDFNKDKTRSDGLAATCRPCHKTISAKNYKNNKDKRSANGKRNYRKNPGRHREYELWHKYGLTVDDYNEMLFLQNNRCVICQQEFVKTGRNSPAHVDHCHKSGEVRAILCTNCDHLLGNAKDDINILQNAIKYLKIFQE